MTAPYEPSYPGDSYVATTHGSNPEGSGPSAVGQPPRRRGSVTSHAGGNSSGDLTMQDWLARDLEFTGADMSRVSLLIHRWAAIVLTEQKRGMVYARLARYVRESGHARFGDYLDWLEDAASPAARQAFINALTTNLTAFFREAHHFVHLSEHLKGRTGPIRIWCAGASTGEEPYSVAITAREALGEAADVKVIATDVDTAALAQAREGVYPLEEIEKLASQRVARHFLRGRGQYARYARLKRQIVDMVEFSTSNLAASTWKNVRGPFDAIFCRNVIIYFDRQTQDRVLSRFRPLLKPDGLLFMGHSENITYLWEHYRLRGQTVYTVAG